MARLNSNVHVSLSEDILRSLYSKKIYTVIDFLDADVKNLTKITTLTYKEIIDIRKTILQKFSAKTVTGLTYYNVLLQNKTVTPTYIENFDKLIDGGISSGFIYELFGCAATGKTQICFTVALNIAQYMKQSVYYIDTKRDFSARRLKNMLDARNCVEEESCSILSRIKVKRINDRFELLKDLYAIKNECLSESKMPVIIIDSLPAVFYTMGDFNAVLSVMNHFVNIIRFICVELHMAVILTNILIPKFSKDGKYVTQDRPGLGKYWENVPSTRIFVIKEMKSNECTLSIIRSTLLKTDESCTVSITEAGVL